MPTGSPPGTPPPPRSVPPPPWALAYSRDDSSDESTDDSDPLYDNPRFRRRRRGSRRTTTRDAPAAIMAAPQAQTAATPVIGEGMSFPPGGNGSPRLPESISPLRAEANPYYGRGHSHSQLTGYVPNAFSTRVMADAPNHASPEQVRRPSIHDRLGPSPRLPGHWFTNPDFPAVADNEVAGVTFPVLDHTMPGYGTPPPNLVPQAASGGFVATTTLPPAPAPAPFYPDYSATAFANGVLKSTGPEVDANAQLIQTLT
jgi:hypothetical protein